MAARLVDRVPRDRHRSSGHAGPRAARRHEPGGERLPGALASERAEPRRGLARVAERRRLVDDSDLAPDRRSRWSRLPRSGTVAAAAGALAGAPGPDARDGLLAARAVAAAVEVRRQLALWHSRLFALQPCPLRVPRSPARRADGHDGERDDGRVLPGVRRRGDEDAATGHPGGTTRVGRDGLSVLENRLLVAGAGRRWSSGLRRHVVRDPRGGFPARIPLPARLGDGPVLPRDRRSTAPLRARGVPARSQAGAPSRPGGGGGSRRARAAHAPRKELWLGRNGDRIRGAERRDDGPYLVHLPALPRGAWHDPQLTPTEAGA